MLNISFSQYCGFLICIVLKEKLIIQIYHALASFMIICVTLMLILIYYALASFTIIPSALHAKILKILIYDAQAGYSQLLQPDCDRHELRRQVRRNIFHANMKARTQNKN